MTKRHYVITSQFTLLYLWSLLKPALKRFGKLAFILCCLLLFIGKANAQTYTKHYIAPAPWQYWSKANEVVVATNSITPVSILIQKSDGTSMATLSATAGNPAVYRFPALPNTLPALSNTLNTVLNGAGMIVTGSQPISVNVRNVASDNLGGEGNDSFIKGNASLFSFGDAAIGNAFRVGYYRDGTINGSEKPIYTIMAIENNTIVKIAGVATATLNAGQSYLFQSAIGTLVETSGPAVMNTSARVDAPGGCGDGAYNPIPPVSSLGSEYVVIRGAGNATAEQTVVVATEPNTTVTVSNFNANGTLQSSSTTTLTAAGSFIQIPNGVGTTQYSATRIQANKNVVAYAGTAVTCEVDIATLAPIAACGGSLRAETYKFRGYGQGTNTPGDLPYFSFILTKSLTDKVFLTTSGSAGTNYTNTDIETLPGVGTRRQLGSSGVYVIDFTNANIGSPSVLTLTCNTRITVAAVQQGVGFSMANYLSPFPQKALKPGLAQSDCATATLSVAPGSTAPFQWYLDGIAIAGATGSSLVATASGSYTVTSQLECGISAQSLPVTVALCNIDRSIVKTVDNASPPVGATINFTLKAKSTGAGNALGVSVKDQLPAGFSYISNTPSAGTSYNNTTGVWSIGALTSNQEVSLIITAKVLATGPYVNTATITGTQTDAVPANDVSSVTVTPSSISVDPGGSDAQTVCINTAITPIVYTLGASATAASATNLPAGVTGVFSSAGGVKKFTISGTPTVTTSGAQTYTVTTTGGTPVSATGTLTVNGIVATPVFAAGANSSRCQGFEVSNYPATASYSSSIAYSIDLPAAGVIDAATGQVTWSSTFTGTAVITATVQGCSGPKSATHTVTVASAGTVATSSPVCSGSNGVLTLNGSSGTVIRWESSIDNGATWTSIVNTSTTLNYTNISTTTSYRAVVQLAGCGSAFSTPAVITVTPRPVISNQTASVCTSGTFNVQPPGAATGTTYSWGAPVKSTPNITGGTAATNQNSISQNVSITGTNAGTITYTVTPTYSGCTGANFTVVVTVVPPLAPTAANPAAICSGSSFSVTPTNTDNGTQYTWTAAQLSGGTVSGFTNLATASAAPISQTLVNTSGSTGVVRYTVTPTLAGCTGSTFTFDVTVNSALANNTVTADQTICANTTPTSLIGSAPTGGSGTYTYLWEQSTDNGVTWTAAAGTNNAISYSPAALTASTQYRRSITSGPCNTANTSAAVTITVQPVLANNTITAPANSSLCVTGDPGIITGSTPAGGSGTYAYQWQISTDNITFTNIGGATGATYDPPVITTTTYYRRQVTSGACAAPLNSNIVQITVNPALTAGTVGGNQSFCQSGTPAAFTELTAATGGDNIYAYQWQSSTTSATTGFTDIAGANQKGYTPSGAINQTTYYRRVVSSTASGCGPQNSNVITVTVNPAIGGNSLTAPAAIAFCNSGDPQVITGAIPTGGSGTYIYSWEQSTDNGQTWTTVGAAVSKDFDPPVLNLTTQYRRVVTSGSCNDRSTPITITVSKTPTVAAAGADQQHCRVDLFTLSGNTPAIGTGVWSVVSGQATIDAPNNPNSTVNVPQGQTATLQWTISNGVCLPSSDQVVLTNFADPTSANAGQNMTQNNSGIFTMQANTPSAGTGMWTVKTGTATIADPANPNTSVTIAPNTTATLTWTITNGPCAASSSDVTISYVRSADITITKSLVTNGPIVAGQVITYQILAANAGPSNATGVAIADVVPASIAVSAITASASGTAAVVQNTSAGNNVNVIADIASGGGNTITITVTGTVGQGFSGNLVNTATATSPNIPDPNGATSTVTTPVTRKPVLSIAKEGPANVIAGDAITYKITISNTGTSDALNTAYADIIPAQVTNTSWTLTKTGAATFAGTGAGTGNNINFTGSIPAGTGNTLVLNVTGTVSPSATGSFTNTVTGTPAEPVPPVNSNTVTTNISAKSGLLILKDGPEIANAGAAITYTLKVTNNGLSDAMNASIVDIVPANIKNVSWTATTQSGATIIGAANGTGNAISVKGNIPTGGTNAINISITGTIEAGFSGSINNSSTATPSEAGSQPSTSTVTTAVTRTPVIGITKTGPATLTAGQPISYTIEVTNTSISDAKALMISDNVPAQITDVTWSAATAGTASIVGAGNGSGNTINMSGDLPTGAGNKITITINGKVSPAFTGTLSNSATATPAEPGTQSKTATSTTQVSRLPVLSILKTGPASITSGQQITYTINVANTSSSNAVQLAIADVVPASIKNVSWTALSSGTALINNGASGTGNNIAINADIPAGSGNKVTVTVSGTVDASFSGSIVNTASATPSETGTTAVSSTATTTAARTPVLSISKTGPASLVSGQQITYNITVNNFSNSDAKALVITDQIPAAISNISWTATKIGTAVLNGTASGTNSAISVNADIPAGSGNAVTIAVTGTVSAGFSGLLSNTATATPAEPGTVAKTATTTATINKIPALTISKSGPGVISAGQQIFYTLVIANASTANADNATIKDIVPASISNVSWTTTTAGTTQVLSGASGSGNDIEIKANVPAGAANTITVNIKGTVLASATAPIVNNATVTPAEPGTTADNTTLTTVVNARPTISLVKTGPANISAGQTVTYTVTATNSGPSNATALSIQDLVSANLSNVSWTATFAGTASITSGDTGTGNNVQVKGNIPAGSGNQIVITITGQVASSALAGTFANTAVATPAEPGTSPVNSNTINTTIDKKVDITAVKAAPAVISAGEKITYTLQIKNNGPSDAKNLVITDVLPAGIINSSWNAITSGAAAVVSGASGSGATVSLIANIPAGTANGILVTVTGTVDPSTSATQLLNAFKTTPAEPGNPETTSNTTTTQIAKTADIRIQKSGPATAVAGQSIAYSITVSNNGPSNTTNVNIQDVIPAGINNINWTATAQNGAVINGTASGTTANVSVFAAIPAGSAQVTINVTGTVDPGFTGVSLVNTATATPEAGVTDPTPASSTVTTQLSRMANIRIIKSGPADITAGEQIVHKLRIVNEGPSNAPGVVINDLIPAGINGVSWSAVAQNGATLTSAASGTGNVNLTANIPAGTAEVDVTITGMVDAGATDKSIIKNTATANLPAGSPVTDPDLSSNTSTVNTKVNLDTELKVSKSGPETVNVGDRIDYQIIVKNGGLSDIVNAMITDYVPNDVAVSSWTASTTGNGSLTSPATGNTNTINVTGNIPATTGGVTSSIVINITGTVKNTAGATFTNTATVVANDIRESSVVTAVNQSTDIYVEKNGPQAVTAGSVISYQIKVGNNGPVDIAGLDIKDNVPAAVTNVSWSASAYGAASITAATGGNTNNIQTTATVPAGAANYILINVQGIVNAATASGNISNTATTTLPLGMQDFNMLNNTSTVSTAIVSTSGLSVRKMGPAVAVSGSDITYTLVVSNAGPSNAVNAEIKDDVPTGVTGVTWTAVAAGNASISAGAGGNNNVVSVIASIPAGAGNTVVVTVKGKIDPGFTGNLVNSATATPSEPGNPPVNSGNVTTTVTNESGLIIVKSGPGTVDAGGTLKYLLQVTNAGPSNAVNALISDAIPAGLTNIRWSAVAVNGAQLKSADNGTTNPVAVTADVPAGAGSVTVTILADVPSNTALQTLTNVASVNPAEPGNPDVTSNQITTNIVRNVSLNISKSAPATLSSGSAISYTLALTNSGPSDALASRLSDVIPAEVGNVSWTSTLAGGATINSGANGTGNNLDMVVNLPVNSTILVNVKGTMDALFTGNSINTAVLAPSEPGETPVNATATTVVKRLTKLQITKTGATEAIAGQQLSYQIKVSNAGPSTALNATISDAIPVQLEQVSWTSSASGAAVITSGATGTGNALNVKANLPAGAQNEVTINITGKVSASYAGNMSNVAIATPADPDNPPVVTPPVVTEVKQRPVIVLSKTGPSTATAGGIVTYTIVAGNTGLSDAANLKITDVVPAQLTGVSWTAVISGNSSINGSNQGSGNNISLSSNIPAGAANKITITVKGTVDPGFAGTVSNTATATPSEDGNPPVITPPVETIVTQSPVIIVNKTGSSTATAGGPISYVIEVSNNGLSNAKNLVVTDVIPADVAAVSWAATASGTSSINGAASGTGNNISVNANIPAGAGNKISIAITGTVKSGFAGKIVNIATAKPAEPGNPAMTSPPVETNVSRKPVVTITKTGQSTAVAGGEAAYLIEAVNTGLSDALAFSIIDHVPAELSNVSWTATSSGTANIISGASGTGSEVLVKANIPAGTGNNKISINLKGVVNPAFAGTIHNIAGVQVPDGNNGTNETPSVDTEVGAVPGITINKNGPPTAVSGTVLTYVITAGNTGLSNARNMAIRDVVPTALTNVSWTTNINGAAVVNSGATGTGNNILVNADIPAGIDNTVTVTVKGTLSASFNGNLINRATATPSEPNTKAVNSDFTTLVNRTPALTIAKNGPASIAAGQPISYTIVVNNTGTANAENAAITDQVPVNISNVSWTATVQGAASVLSGASGSGNNVVVNASIPAGAGNGILINVNGTLNAGATADLINKATVTPAEAGTTPSDATVTTKVNATPTVTVVKTGPTRVSAGETVTYTLAVGNSGPSDARNLAITDAVPVMLTNVSWTAGVSGSASLLSGASGTGNNVQVAANINAGAANQVLITITGQVPSSAAAGSISNTAKAKPSEPGIAEVSSNTVNTVIDHKLGIRAVKSAPSSISAGQSITYTLQVFNDGPGDAVALGIADAIPAGINNVSWTTNVAGTATIAQNGTGTGSALAMKVNIPAGAANFITVVVKGDVDPGFTGTTLMNSFTVSPQEPGNPPVTSEVVTTNVNKIADLRILKTGPSSAVAGSAISYTLTVTNAGPGNAGTVNIVDAIPAGITNLSWAAVAQNGASIVGTATGTGNVNLNALIPAGGNASVVVTLNGTVDANYAGTAIINTATATPGAGITDPTPATSTVTTATDQVANVRVVKSGPANIAAGEMITYNLRVVNDGPSNAIGVVIKDQLPANIEAGATWTASTLNGATVSVAAGTGDVDLTGSIPSGTGQIDIVVKGKVKANNLDGTSFVNTATANFPPGSLIKDPDPSSNISSVNTVVNNDPVLKVSKSGPSRVNIGDPINYTIVIRNGGAGNITNAMIVDPVPADVAVSSWNVVATGGATITGANSGITNAVNTTADIPADANPNTAITINISGTVKTTAGAMFTNTVTVTANGERTSSVVTAVNQSTDIYVEKTGPQEINAGALITYTVKVGNNGPVAVSGLTINDQVPAEIGQLSWTAQSFGSATLTGAGSGTTNAVQTVASVPLGAGNYILLTVKGVVKASTKAAEMTNTASVMLPAGLSDFDLSNNSSTVNTVITSKSGLVISKTGPQDGIGGSAITYTLKVVNTGPSDAAQAVITDLVPAAIRNVSWQAVSSGAANLVSGAAGTGNSVLVSANIPAGTGNEIFVTINGTVDAGFSGTLQNTAVVTPAEKGNPPSTSGTVTTTVLNKSGVRLIKSGPSNAEAGKTVNYTLELTNTGPGNAMNLDLSDVVPATLANVSWTATASNGAVIRSGATGTGNTIGLKVDMPAGVAKVTVNITALVPANTVLANFSNTATATPSEPGNPAVVSNVVTTAVVNNANLSLVKSGPANANSGETIAYILRIGNSGPSDATGVKIRDVVPVQLSEVIWNSSVNGGAVITAGASGNVNDVQLTANIPANGSIAVMITGKIDPLYTGPIANRATLTPADPAKPVINSDVTTAVKNLSSLKITKTGAGTIIAGQQMKYQIILSNGGPGTARNVVVTDQVPAAMSNVSWTAVASGAAGISTGQTGTGNSLRVVATVPPTAADFITINLIGTVDPSLSGKISNIATATPQEPGNPPVVSPPVETQVSRKPGVIITKAGPQTAKSGDIITYVVEVTNTGISDALALAINDKISADIVNVSWTTAVTGKAKVLSGATGKGSNVSILADVPSGAANKVTLTITGMVSKSYTGKITNTAQTIPSEGLPEVLSNTVETIIDVSDFIIPNIITPNNDGNNDTFKIKGLENYPGTQVQVFNRWGNEVFRANDYKSDWDGSQLNEGTYYYLINRKEKSGTFTVFKGWLFIKR
uniref:T9SS type B sorting domain-containing protein n=1 Tax=Pedobacter schmidteae TaxID=2201271 RepID=UPI000EAC94DF|nr:gliding motility-associated C-terminal domain-containing protein [Pedobacter schmidteae]